MNISSVSSVSSYHSNAVQQSLANVAQQQHAQPVDNDGDHDNGAPDGVRGRTIDVKA